MPAEPSHPASKLDRPARRAQTESDAPAAGGTHHWAAMHSALSDVRREIIDAEALRERDVAAVHPDHRASARNLVRYLAFRQRDIRSLQSRLAGAGLSSLGRAEASVLESIDAVLEVLACLGEPDGAGGGHPAPAARGHERLERHTVALLGPRPAGRRVRVMVTMPAEAECNAALLTRLIESGMNVARINCAHDDASAWERMAANVREAARKAGRPCKVMMDLAGPKLRTGPLEPGPRVLKWGPTRDERGTVIRSAAVWLGRDASMAGESIDALVPVDPAWAAALQPGSVITFKDLRGSERALQIVRAGPGGALARADQTAYVGEGTALHTAASADASAGSGGARSGGASVALVGDVPALERPITLVRGDRLVLKRDSTPGRPAAGVGTPAFIGCQLPAVLDDVRLGERVWLDDGKIGGVVREIRADGVELEIVAAPEPGARGVKLRADKGINLPDTGLRLRALTEKDAQDARFVARHADIVGLSFVQRASDVEDLRTLLSEHSGGRDVGIVLKIETARAFRALPELLLSAMRGPVAGVMIARGDLAVEVGYERLAEVQEEILWLCEAAHLPVIWATQVLESLAKSGRPSRAEVTDAAMGERAECVMLNKGPFIVEAVKMLDGILRRMEAHQFKKSSLLRPLRVAGRGG